MGLAASQGRLLLLTARKSDLEFRAQEISQRRLILATELESVASEYARASANRQMKLTTMVQMGNANKTAAVNLTFFSLYQHGCIEYVETENEDGSITSEVNTLGASIYRVKNSLGQVVVPSSLYIPKSPQEAGYGENVTRREEGNKVIFEGTDDADGNVYVEYVIDKNLACTEETENFFQEGLRNGKYIIEQLTSTDGNGNAISQEWQPIGWSGMTEIQDNYYTEDDAYAQAKYQSASARVQAQDKKLETDQKQIETQHKAVETEFESVQKVITNNIESSFKMFS